ncbi:hypothetical protein AVEN_272318-1 [Araneus ventricosus]|uniref:Uncharacterized protein n=1 Tax=Araneus ventricosus TaxID=182803 RepID=A0A4Y2IXU9_ARAVE|nr:hypothetical protein AVEN_272318-1 [Araneus ventricosus]
MHREKPCPCISDRPATPGTIHCKSDKMGSTAWATYNAREPDAILISVNRLILCQFVTYDVALCAVSFSLVILTSRFESTRGLFWDGPRNFHPRSDDEDDTRAGTPSPNFHATPTRRRLATTYDLTCNRPHTRQIFSGIGFRTWNPPAPKPRPYHKATAASVCGQNFSPDSRRTL